MSSSSSPSSSASVRSFPHCCFVRSFVSSSSFGRRCQRQESSRDRARRISSISCRREGDGEISAAKVSCFPSRPYHISKKLLRRQKLCLLKRMTQKIFPQIAQGKEFLRRCHCIPAPMITLISILLPLLLLRHLHRSYQF